MRNKLSKKVIYYFILAALSFFGVVMLCMTKNFFWIPVLILALVLTVLISSFLFKAKGPKEQFITYLKILAVMYQQMNAKKKYTKESMNLSSIIRTEWFIQSITCKFYGIKYFFRLICYDISMAKAPMCQ